MESAKPFIVLHLNTYGSLTSNHKLALIVEAARASVPLCNNVFSDFYMFLIVNGEFRAQM